MPIYQHRIIRLVEAGESFIGFRDRCNSIIHLVSAGRVSPQDAISTIAEYITQVDEYAEHVIKDERSRYNVTSHRNDVERERMRARRAGIPFIPPMAESTAARVTRLAAEHEARQYHPPGSGKRVTRFDSGVEPMTPERFHQAINADDDSDLDFSGQPSDWNEENEAEYRKAMGKE